MDLIFSTSDNRMWSKSQKYKIFTTSMIHNIIKISHKLFKSLQLIHYNTADSKIMIHISTLQIHWQSVL